LLRDDGRPRLFSAAIQFMLNAIKAFRLDFFVLPPA
jgi:hypothetical protein